MFCSWRRRVVERRRHKFRSSYIQKAGTPVRSPDHSKQKRLHLWPGRVTGSRHVECQAWLSLRRDLVHELSPGPTVIQNLPREHQRGVKFANFRTPWTIKTGLSLLFSTAPICLQTMNYNSACAPAIH
eukprot:746545-Hanusia_phi.AAC.4